MVNAQQKKELIRFLIAGIIVQIVDLAVYHLMLVWIDFAPAKAIAFFWGTVTAFILGKFFTFRETAIGNSARQARRFLVLYATAMLINVAVNSLALYVIRGIGAMLENPTWLGEALIVNGAWFVATGTSAVYNFLGQKFYVFRGEDDASTEPAGPETH